MPNRTPLVAMGERPRRATARKESREIRDTALTEIECGEGDEHAQKGFDHVQAAVVGNLQAEMIKLLVEARLCGNRRGFDIVARPCPERIGTRESHVERAADVALRRLGKAGEFLHLANQQRAPGWLTGFRRHDPDSFCLGGSCGWFGFQTLNH